MPAKSAKNTPLSGEPTSSGDISGREFDIYQERSILPDDPRKLAACEEHVAGVQGALLVQEFLMGACSFPRSDEQPRIRFQLGCSGLSGTKCKLAITQYDANGKKIAQGHI